MKTYIVYVDGVELPKSQWIKAAGHNQAEKKAQKQYPGKQVSVVYTEVWMKTFLVIVFVIVFIALFVGYWWSDVGWRRML